MTTPSDFWLDAHLDLAYMALERSPEAPTLENEADTSRFAITRPALERGRVRLCFATIFTAPGEEAHEPWGYRDHDDRDGAHRAGMRQLELYEHWEARGWIRIARTREDLVRAETAEGPPTIVLLMECADPIRTPDEADRVGPARASNGRDVMVAWLEIQRRKRQTRRIDRRRDVPSFRHSTHSGWRMMSHISRMSRSTTCFQSRRDPSLRRTPTCED